MQDDLISREKALNIACQCGIWAVRAIENLPSVNPKPIECDDVVSRKDVINAIDKWISEYKPQHYLIQSIRDLPPVTQKSGKCKECKYFEYDSVAKVDGIPLIVAHEICNKWGGGCKSSEDGYCYLFEPQERSE